MKMKKPTYWTAIVAAALLGAGGAFAGCGGEGADGVPGEGSAAAEDRSAEDAQLATAEFAVDGMTCGGCALATEISVKKVAGVVDADAELDDATGEGSCTVRYDPARTGPEAIAQAIRNAGFQPRLAASNAGS